ncbi:hypothetical protein [Bradyrhizobium sp. ARR65]|uniref:hypothetical protein n=1 Tax=Bradyrhizobium sp. ARR65 TaxID=1040989 RepID=UPI000AE7ECF2|nr:hypothetical protein [Bradyrhizobium sp. ARR65]
MDERAVALRANAAHCMSVARLMGKEERARLIQTANDWLERASKLEQQENGGGKSQRK